MEKILITTIGLGLIAAIYWFFFGKKEEASETKTSWNITVEGGYMPATIRIPNGRTSTITFTRTDPNSCLEEVVLPEFKIKKFLQMNQPVIVTLSPTKTGVYSIHCGMNMFHGKVYVV